MNQISENLFHAIDIIIQERLKDLSFDRTIIGTVSNNDSSAEGFYTINYQDVSFLAQSNFTDLQINDQVYVLIPENDETNRRFILGVYSRQGGVTND